MRKAVYCALSLLCAHAAADTIRFNPDSYLNGELKLLERGKIHFKTDATGTIRIDMEDVLIVVSSERLSIELENGVRMLGYLREPSQSGYAAFESGSFSRSIPLADIVSITPIESEFRERFDGEINAGLNFAKDSDILQTNFGVAADYVADNIEFSLNINSTATRDSSDQTSQRSALRFNTLRPLKNRLEKWKSSFRLDLERNDGLGTDLRSSVGAGLERALRQSNHQRLDLVGGLLFTSERSAGEDGAKNSLEGYLGINYDLFQYDAPEVDISTSLEIIPSLTNWGRYRANADLTLKWEFFDDIFWRLSFYNSFDSDPQSAEGDRNDFGVNTGVALEF